MAGVRQELYAWSDTVEKGMTLEDLVVFVAMLNAAQMPMSARIFAQVKNTRLVQLTVKHQDPVTTEAGEPAPDEPGKVYRATLDS